MIHLNKIELTNFGSFESQSFDFQSGKYLIIGQNNSSSSAENNGSGKSLLFESIPWCIYGYSTRDKDVSRNHNGKCCVKLYFTIGENQYRIERYYRDEAFGNKVKLFCNEEEDITCKNIADTERQIIALGFPPYDLFVSTITVLQGMPVNFSQLTNVQRKEILEELFGFSIWETYRNKIKKQLVIYKNNRTILESQYTNTREKYIALDSKIKTLKETNQSNLDELNKMLNDISNHLKELQDEYFKIDAEFKAIKFDNNEYQKSVTEQNQYEYELKTYEKILNNKNCPTCNQPFPVEKIEQAEHKVQKFRTKIAELTTLNKQLNETKTIYDEKKSRLNILEMEIQVNKGNFRKLKEQKESSTNTNLDNVSHLETQLIDLQTTTNEYKTKLTDIENKIDGATYIDTLLLPSSSFRTSIMSQYLTYVNSIIDSISPSIFDDLKINLIIDEKGKGIDIQLNKGKLNNLEYSELSGGEKKRLDIILILSLQKFLLESSGISINLIVFDEIFDTLDSKGIDNIISCLDYMYAEDTCIYIISHNSSLKNMFENTYIVQKNNHISSIL